MLLFTLPFTLLFVFLGDSAELWVTLNAMGYDYNLVQDESALFKVAIYVVIK